MLTSSRVHHAYITNDIYLLDHSVEHNPSKEDHRFSASQKFLAFYGIRKFIPAFTSARHPSLLWASSIQSITHIPLPGDLNIILPYTPGSPERPISIRLSHQNPVYTSPLSHMCYMLRPSHSSWFNHLNNIWWVVNITKLLIMKFSPLPYYLVPLGPIHRPQHPILKHPQPTFLPQY